MNLENFEITNTNNGWLADSLIRSDVNSRKLQGEMLSASSSPQFAVQRSLLLPIGEAAAKVAHQAVAISQAWLQLQQLPMRVVDTQMPDNAQMPDRVGAIVAACNGLADARLVRRFQTQGYLLKHTNEINLWILLAFSGEEYTAEGAAHLTAWIEEATQQVRSTLKVQLTAHLLLLCEPQHQNLAALWAGTLQNLCENRIYLCGPVNQHHLRLDDWEEQAGATLAGLLWSERSQPGVSRWNDPASCWVNAVGATGWRSPHVQLRNWLATRWVAHQFRLLEGTKPERATHTTGPSVLPDLPLLERQLAACVPTIPQPHSPFMRWPNWAQLSSLPVRLQRWIETILASRSTQQAEARNGWLAGALVQFGTPPGTDELMRDAATITTLAALQEERVYKQQSLYSLSDAVEDRLCLIEAAIEEQQQRCTQMYGVLGKSCAQFPRNTIGGVIGALTSPWRWWRWAICYFVDLPEQSQQWINAEINLVLQRWEQSNLLTIRQLVLALLQDLRQQERTCTAIAEQLAALKHLLSEQERQQTEGDLNPWNAQRLACLLTQVKGSDIRWQQPLIGLTEVSTEETQALFERYWRAALETNQTVLSWPVSHILNGALPEPVLRQQWLAQLWEDATPLWPSETLLPSEESVNWLLQAETETDQLQDEMPANCQPGHCHFPGLLVVREVAVNLVMGVEGRYAKFEE